MDNIAKSKKAIKEIEKSLDFCCGIMVASLVEKYFVKGIVQADDENKWKFKPISIKMNSVMQTPLKYCPFCGKKLLNDTPKEVDKEYLLTPTDRLVDLNDRECDIDLKNI